MKKNRVYYLCAHNRLMKTPLGSFFGLALTLGIFAISTMNAQVATEDQALLEKVVYEVNNGHPAAALKISATLETTSVGFSTHENMIMPASPRYFPSPWTFRSFSKFGKMDYPGIIGASVLQASTIHINFADSVMVIEQKSKN